MKLKITDEKLDELCKQLHDDLYARVGSFFTAEHYEMAVEEGFRAAEQEHQATIDKLMQIIEMQREAFMYIDESKPQTDLLEAADKMMKELNGE